ncbi:MAG: hypothetical protein B7Z78_04380 [Rhodospirillales bacterium 20-60-12]|nr:MAG: hypothetical protein B7Z78_04380 [Rhodospirillales bacterium 20-60-12]HQT67784.1 lipid A deacylase LpxR family protein [Acetobacteraceae bacterium]
MKHIVRAGLLSGLVFSLPIAALAQTLPPPDPDAIYTFQDENASISTQTLTDRFYVNGFHFGYVSPTGDLPDVLANLGHGIWGAGQQRLSINIQQQLFTPVDTKLINPNPADEPYAGYLALNAQLIQDTMTSRSVIGASVGLIGPDAGGEIIQNGFHGVISQGTTHGWAYQLPNEPAIDVMASRTWRESIGQLGGLSVDVLPELDGQAGTTLDYVQAGSLVRIGEGLDSDFGPSRLAPGMTGTDAYTPTRPFVWYLFAGLDGRAVAHDVFLDGANFQSSRSVSKQPLVGEIEFGGAVIYHGLRFTFTQVFQSQTFHHQQGGIHEFGVFALSTRF